MYSFFGWIFGRMFGFTWKIQQRIDWTYTHIAKSKKSLAFQSMILYFSLAFVLLTNLFFNFGATSAVLGSASLAIGLLIIFVVSYIIVNFKNILVSVRRFLFTGVICNLVITILVFCVSRTFRWNDIITSVIDTFLPSFWKGMFNGGVIIFITTFGVLWAFFSILANSKVSTTANAIVAAGLAILLAMSSSFLCFFPQNFSFGIRPTDILKLKNNGYSPTQFIQIIISLLTMPFIIINGVSMLLAQLKGYWVEKYNDGNEITW